MITWQSSRVCVISDTDNSQEAAYGGEKVERDGWRDGCRRRGIITTGRRRFCMASDGRRQLGSGGGGTVVGRAAFVSCCFKGRH